MINKVNIHIIIMEVNMIELKNISKSYKGKSVFTNALINVSLDRIW